MQIVDRFLAGTLDASYTPALFFGHFGNGQKLGEGALKAHLSLFLKGGADIRGGLATLVPSVLGQNKFES